MMVTRKNKEGAKIQHGAAAALQQRGSSGADKDAVSEPPKTPKAAAGDQPRDMRFYTQKLSGLAAEPEDLPEGKETLQEEVEGDLAHADEEEEAEGDEKTEQSTLAAILRAVKCTASVNTLQERFGGLKEEVTLIR